MLASSIHTAVWALYAVAFLELQDLAQRKCDVSGVSGIIKRIIHTFTRPFLFIAAEPF